MNGPDTSQAVAWIIRQKDMIQFAWRRALMASDKPVRERWAECARDLEKSLQSYLDAHKSIADRLASAGALPDDSMLKSGDAGSR